MRIGCLQFAPRVGDVDNNLNRADAVLSKANSKDLDLLVLPEMAFSGYNFRSLNHISPFLEPTTSGISSLWARTTALKYNCVTIVGYPEKVDITPKWPTSPEYYNSAIIVNKDGETIANYRKSFLYYTDERWALEGPDGFFDGEIDGLGNTAIGICKWPTKSFERMDLNPYKFEAPWSAWEFSYHILHKQANLVILSMAWLTREDPRAYSRTPKEPDMDTLAYWLARLEPVIRAETEGEIIVVFANRSGSEEEATYAGTSAILGIQGGEVKVYGILGRSENELLVVDTNKRPCAKLVSMPNSAVSQTSEASEASTAESTFSNKSDASGLTVDTACTSPSLDVSMADIMSPVLPADPSSPNAYFAKGKTPISDTLLDSLKSSTAEPGFQPVFPDSPPLIRPPSPKSRNASRTRQLDDKLPPLTHVFPGSPPESRNSSQTRQLDEKEQNPALLDSTTFKKLVDKELVSTPALPESPTLQRHPADKEQVSTPALPDAPILEKQQHVEEKQVLIPALLDAPILEKQHVGEKQVIIPALTDAPILEKQHVERERNSTPPILDAPILDAPILKEKKHVEEKQVLIPALPDAPILEKRQDVEREQDLMPPILDAPILEEQQHIEEKQITNPDLPNSLKLKRPHSPKSRNASRTRQPNEIEPALGLHDLAEEDQIPHKTIRIRSPQQTASSSLERYQTSFTSQTFGSRSAYINPRPKSSIW